MNKGGLYRILLIFSLVLFTFGFSVTAQVVPSDLMRNCKQWKITYPNGSEDKTLCNEANNEYFFLNTAGTAIVFKAPIRSDNGTTPNSSYIRSELRERTVTGNADVYWTTAGKHMVYVKQAITHLPINKSHLVATQIHGNKSDGIDDAMVLRLEDSHLFLSFNGGVLRSNISVKSNYTLGTVHEVIFVVEDGKHYCYYSEAGGLLAAYNNGTASSYLIKDGSNDYVMDKSYVDSYFKIGNYTQSNADKEGSDTGDEDNYGEVVVYDFTVVHGGSDVSGVSLSPSSLNLQVDASYAMNGHVTPSDATNNGVSYKSSNTEVATVSATGVVVGHSAGEATITLTSDEGNYEATSSITVVAEPTQPNLALNKSITGTGTHDDVHEVSNLVDGLTSSRWSVSGFPQTAIVDLGEKYAIGRTEVVCYTDRAYQYTISVSDTENGTYTEIVNRSDNEIQGFVSNPIIDLIDNAEGRYVKIEVTGANTYSGTWVSLLEFRVFETASLNVQDNHVEYYPFIWPNPASNYVNFSGFDYFTSLEIYDQMGSLVRQQSTKNKSINTLGLASGLYTIRFFGAGKTIEKRILIAK